MSEERFVLRLKGGPWPGQYVIDGDLTLEGGQARGWPWPGEIKLASSPGGRYVKEGESALASQPPDSHTMRGAEYQWLVGRAAETEPSDPVEPSELAAHGLDVHVPASVRAALRNQVVQLDQVASLALTALTDPAGLPANV
ncbi:MAG TPA: hypothetical protein VG265_13495, partial [Gaiellaceae bacterium]|nr:hypothetical protein [Gaiellaceae bacterium]